jgi:phospholipid-binding lipoprotein MlaA
MQVSSCATKNNSVDPQESFNRKIYAFNNVVDSLALKPAAVVYTHITPPFVRDGVHNVFNNINEVTDISNDLLQGKLTFAANDSLRLLVNSTWGIGGTIDVAQSFNLPPHDEDFGLTLATWSGEPNSTFFVFPILGPSTNRDAVGSLFDLFVFSAWPYFIPKNIYYPLLITWAIDKRAQLLPADQLIQQSFDPYIFIRDAYTTMRLQEIKDNKLTYQQYLQNFINHRNPANADTTDDSVTVANDNKANTKNADDDSVIVVG